MAVSLLVIMDPVSCGLHCLVMALQLPFLAVCQCFAAACPCFWLQSRNFCCIMPADHLLQVGQGKVL